MKATLVYATGDAGRRLVQVIYRKPGRPSMTIERRNHKGELIGIDRGGRTQKDTEAVSTAILLSQRYRSIEFKRNQEYPSAQSDANGGEK